MGRIKAILIIVFNMSLLTIYTFIVVAFFFTFISIVFLLIRMNKQKKQIKWFEELIGTNDLAINELQLVNNNLHITLESFSSSTEQSLLENAQVSKQLEHRIKALQQQVSAQQDIISLLQTQQGEDKLYTRAFKLADKGAGIDEIVTDCELPRAEVEMLLSVYNKKIRR